MKPTCYLALLVLATGVAATAQTRSFTPSAPQSSNSGRGATASTGSQAPRRTFVAPPPRTAPNAFESACSGTGISPLIPSAMGCTDPRFTSGFFYPDARGGAVNLRPRYSHSNPVYVPYPVYVDGQAAAQDAQEPDPPAPTIFEHRAIPAPVHAAVASSTAPDTSHSGAPVQQSRSSEGGPVPIVLVFRDGHRAEVQNYAIVGQTLYDLGTFVAHKIPLSNLDLKATIQANQERGVEFSLPASTKVE